MDKDLQNILEQVKDEKSFLLFVDALLQDRIDEVSSMKDRAFDDFGRGPLGWQNHTIVDFLEAAKTWGEDTGMGFTQDLENASVWRTFATFLYAGKIYE